MKSKWVIGFVIFLAVLGVINLIDFSESPSLAPEERRSCVCLPDVSKVNCIEGYTPIHEVTKSCEQSLICTDESCEYDVYCKKSVNDVYLSLQKQNTACAHF